MKKLLSISILALAVLAVAATAPRYISTRDTAIRNADNTPGLTIIKTGTQTGNVLEYYLGGALKFGIPKTGLLPVTYGGTGAATTSAAKTALGIQSGSVTTAGDGTVTNTFATAFSSAPVLVISQTGDATSATNTFTVSITNFVYSTGQQAVVAKWIAVGAP